MIYENYTGQILQTAHSLARNHMDAEDIAQDVFLKIINNIDTIQTENPFTASSSNHPNDQVRINRFTPKEKTQRKS